MLPRVFSVCALLLASCCAFSFVSSASAACSSQAVSQSDTARPSPAEALRSAQTIFIRTKSAYFKPAALEQSLLERDEVQQWGFVISRDETDADLIIEVDRKLFTNRFVYSVIDPRTSRVLLGGKIGSLGGSVETQIANDFIKRIRSFRSFSPPSQTG